MGMRLFSDKRRPAHLGPYPLERLLRQDGLNLANAPAMKRIRFQRPDAPENITNAMDEYQSMLDALRDGLVNKSIASCPTDPLERANHLKGFGYFCDASMIGCCLVPEIARLTESIRNPGIDHLAEKLKSQQTKTLAAGIDSVMAELKESMEAPPTTIEAQTHAVVFLYEFPRNPHKDEPGTDWVADAQAARACLRASETTVVIANYLRLLGYESRAHSQVSTDVDLHLLTLAAGLASVENGTLVNPYVGDRFGVAAVTTRFVIATDQPLAPLAQQPRRKTHGLAWQVGKGFTKTAFNREPFANRRYVDSEHPFEKLKRVATPTTFIDEERVARVPKRTDMFARAVRRYGQKGAGCQQRRALCSQGRPVHGATPGAGCVRSYSKWRPRPND